MRARLITFDVYMALLDIQGSLTPVVTAATGLAPPQAASMVALWRSRQMERAASSNALAGPHTAFRDCTAMALDHACQQHGISLDGATREALIGAWYTLSPWPEADAALATLSARGHTIAILSNGDQDMLEAAAARFSTRFDHVLSAQSAGYYKPHPAVYDLPRGQLGVAPDDTVHVAGSANDVLGAIAFGLRCVWSNRTGAPLVDPAYPPTRQISHLGELPALLEGDR